MQSSASPGGNGANQALAARRAGAGVRLARAIGHDPVGADALALLKDASVDLSLVRAVKHSTGTAHVVVDAVGENSVVAWTVELMSGDGQIGAHLNSVGCLRHGSLSPAV
ncbi:hypothetical protein GOC09_16630 [Sinorhizobium meliloti]|nr:hypothetical protein [Sinorhizobium meliloti]MDW9836001.1 hypothetical protein [Sinorhizobium meliloti]MDX0040310.1 hypothetical protein [Sinorhizobium meliloti]MDX0088832.1 hypothetical protein [Sinorhizobium meliloti]